MSETNSQKPLDFKKHEKAICTDLIENVDVPWSMYVLEELALDDRSS